MINSIKLAGIKKTSNETVVEVQFGSEKKFFMLSQSENDNTFDKKSQDNKDSVLLSNGSIIHNMYDLDKVWYHNQAARQHRYPYEGSKHDYQHIYKRPDTQSNNTLACMTRLGDTFYGLDTLGTKGHSYVNDEMYKWLLNDNGWNVPPCQSIATMLYAKGTLSDLVDADDEHLNYFSEDELSTSGVFPLSAIVGVKYNTIYEIPGSMKQDYSKGEIIANTFKGKNQYDAEWSMIKGNASDSVLINARNYYEINSCGGTLWLKYKTTENYRRSAETSEIQHPRYFKQINASATVGALAAAAGVQEPALPHVEVVTRINRGVEVPQHKTALYSLSLRTTLLENIVPASTLQTQSVRVNAAGQIVGPTEQATSTVDAIVGLKSAELEKMKQTLKAEIKNCIRKIAERIAPANSQLFNVTIES